MPLRKGGAMEGRDVLSGVRAACLAVACVLLVANCGNGGGQSNLPISTEQWARTYGGAGDEQASSRQLTTEGGYIVAGSTRSVGAGDLDAWVVKLDSSGNVVWQRTYGGASTDLAHDI